MKKLLQHDVIQKRVLFTAWDQTSRCKLKREKSVVMLQLFVRSLLEKSCFTPSCYKIGLIQTLIDRIHKINNTSSGLQNDLNKLSDTLKRNSFPSHISTELSSAILTGLFLKKAGTLMMTITHVILNSLLSAIIPK